METLQQALNFLLNSLVLVLTSVVAVFVFFKARSERLQASSSSKSVGITKKSLDSAFAPTPTKPQPTAVETKTLKTSQTSIAKQQTSIPITVKASEQTELFELIDAKINPDSKIRKSVAESLGKLAASQQAKPYIQQTIAVLGKLSQDTEPSVRQAATIALGETKSAKALPFLKRALRDFDSDVVKSASAAIAQFKSHPVTPKEKPPAKKRSLFSVTS
jgi:HEAT repeats